MERGITTRPDPAQLDELAREIQSRGGMHLSEPCIGSARKLSGGQNFARSQFCGLKARFEVPYADGSGKYIACANCDGVTLFPTPKEPA